MRKLSWLLLVPGALRKRLARVKQARERRT